MAGVRFGVVPHRLFSDVATPQNLIENIPGIADVVEGAENLRQLNDEGTRLSWFHNKGITLRHVAKIDAYLQTFLDHVHQDTCDCGKPLYGSGGKQGNHKEWFFAWMEKYGKAFKAENNIVR